MADDIGFTTGMQGAGIRHMASKSGYYTVSEAAELVGRSVDTLRRWRKEGGPDGGPLFCPSHSEMFGALKVFLYTDEDIEVLRDIAGVVRPGKKAVAG